MKCNLQQRDAGVSNVQGLPLAVKALQELHRQRTPRAASARLVVAGGYDKRLAENREHFQEMQQLVSDLHLDGQVGHLLHKGNDVHICLSQQGAVHAKQLEL